MNVDPITTTPTIGLGDVARAHEALNAAYAAIATDRTPAALTEDVELARGYMHEARTHLTDDARGHLAADEARLAAREVLPRLDHALQLLDVLGTTRDETHLVPLLDELGAAMDRVELVLAGAGWD